jgi:hypothetical protein
MKAPWKYGNSIIQETSSGVTVRFPPLSDIRCGVRFNGSFRPFAVIHLNEHCLRMLAVHPWVIALSAMLSACGQGSHDPERYVLTGNDKNLFFHTQLSTDPGKADEIIAEVERFGRQHGMDVLVARKTLPPGDFNLSANAPTINLRAMHTAGMGDTGVQIFAIVPDTPTPTDKKMVREFVSRLRKIR